MKLVLEHFRNLLNEKLPDIFGSSVIIGISIFIYNYYLKFQNDSLTTTIGNLWFSFNLIALIITMLVDLFKLELTTRFSKNLYLITTSIIWAASVMLSLTLLALSLPKCFNPTLFRIVSDLYLIIPSIVNTMFQVMNHLRLIRGTIREGSQNRFIELKTIHLKNSGLLISPIITFNYIALFCDLRETDRNLQIQNWCTIPIFLFIVTYCEWCFGQTWFLIPQSCNCQYNSTRRLEGQKAKIIFMYMLILLCEHIDFFVNLTIYVDTHIPVDWILNELIPPQYPYTVEVPIKREVPIKEEFPEYVIITIFMCIFSFAHRWFLEMQTNLHQLNKDKIDLEADHANRNARNKDPLFSFLDSKRELFDRLFCILLFLVVFTFFIIFLHNRKIV